MLHRLASLLILIIILGIPLGIYFYFFRGDSTMITFVPTHSGSYTLILDGTLEYRYLPLADKALHLEKVCDGICTLSLPPALYTLSASSPGRVVLTDEIRIHFGEKKEYTIDLPLEFSYERSVTQFSDNSQIEQGLLLNANDRLGGLFYHIGTGKGGKYLARRETAEKNEVGILTVEKFISLMTLPFVPDSVALDQSRQYLVVSGGGDDQYVISIDTRDTITFPMRERVILVDRTKQGWKVKTTENVYEYLFGSWKKNPRFTDFIDVSPSERIGYIDAKDTKKLSLQNLPDNTAIIQIIYRNTGEEKILKKGLNIRGFTHIDGAPIFIDSEGILYNIHSFSQY